jgi:hypothetical protein
VTGGGNKRKHKNKGTKKMKKILLMILISTQAFCSGDSVPSSPDGVDYDFERTSQEQQDPIYDAREPGDFSFPAFLTGNSSNSNHITTQEGSVFGGSN